VVKVSKQCIETMTNKKGFHYLRGKLVESTPNSAHSAQVG